MDFKQLLRSQGFKRFSILVLICIIIYSLRSMANVLLLTLLFTFLMGSLHRAVLKVTDRFFSIHPKVILPVLYVLLITTIVLGVYKLFPLIGNEIMQLVGLIHNAYYRPHDTEFGRYIVKFLDSLESIDFRSYIQPGMGIIMKVSNIGLNVLIALILSLFFLMEKSNIAKFSSKFLTSKLSWLFVEIDYFGTKFAQTFGKVIEAQLLISLINTILTSLMLWALGFPHMLGLALIVFLLGLIPVAGAFISLFPLSFIAFSIGGVEYVIIILIFVAILHAFEAYVLNPKLMSSKTHLPIFYTFIILIVSEHIFGIWGLIIGIPIFVFILDVIDVKTIEVKGADTDLPKTPNSDE